MCGWNYLFIPKLQRCKQLHHTLYWSCDYSSMLGSKLNHKRCCRTCATRNRQTSWSWTTIKTWLFNKAAPSFMVFIHFLITAVARSQHYNGYIFYMTVSRFPLLWTNLLACHETLQRNAVLLICWKPMFNPSWTFVTICSRNGLLPNNNPVNQWCHYIIWTHGKRVSDIWIKCNTVNEKKQCWDYKSWLYGLSDHLSRKKADKVALLKTEKHSFLWYVLNRPNVL